MNTPCAVAPRSYCPFPVDALPGVLRLFVEQAAAALGCDPAYVALPALAVYGSLIGNARVVQLKGGWSEPCVLWTVLVGESGTLKSPALQQAAGFLFQKQRGLLSHYEVAQEKYRVNRHKYEEQNKKLRMPWDPELVPPVQPACRRLVVADITLEKLASVLADNPRGTLVVRDELAGWLGTLMRYRSAGPGGALACWLEMHRAGPLLVDRKGTERPHLFVPRAAVSVTGGIQPGVLARVLAAEHREAGLVARLLLAMPPRTARQWNEVEIDPAVLQAYEQVAEALGELGFDQEHNGEQVPVAVTLGPEAKARWVEFYQGWAKRQAEAGIDEAAALAKLEGYAARLALVHHVVENVAQVQDREPMEVASVEAGITLARWFHEEAERIYAVLGEDQIARDTGRLVGLVRARGGRITVRELMRSIFRHKTSARAQAALSDLVAAGLGEWEESATGEKGAQSQRVFCLRGLPAKTTGAGDVNAVNAVDAVNAVARA